MNRMVTTVGLLLIAGFCSSHASAQQQSHPDVSLIKLSTLKPEYARIKVPALALVAVPWHDIYRTNEPEVVDAIIDFASTLKRR